MSCFRKSLTLLITVLMTAAALSAQTPPEKFLGFKVGADTKLADYNQIKAYFELLAKESPRLKLLTIGESTMKKPIIMAVISSEENLAKLDRYREILKKLRDPRTLSADEAVRLAKEGKAIILITCSLHSSEIGASQMSMELAYDLVTGKTPYDAKKILNDTILLLCPTHNPDGEQMVVDWYKKYVGTKYEGGSMPYLYHYYAGHDDNRDWYMFNLAETRAVSKVLYHDWLPLVHLDQHQQGSNGARLFIPPLMDPPLPNIHPLVWRTANLMGTSMAYDLQQNGKSGDVARASSGPGSNLAHRASHRDRKQNQGQNTRSPGEDDWREPGIMKDVCADVPRENHDGSNDAGRQTESSQLLRSHAERSDDWSQGRLDHETRGGLDRSGTTRDDQPCLSQRREQSQAARIPPLQQQDPAHHQAQGEHDPGPRRAELKQPQDHGEPDEAAQGSEGRSDRPRRRRARNLSPLNTPTTALQARGHKLGLGNSGVTFLNRQLGQSMNHTHRTCGFELHFPPHPGSRSRGQNLFILYTGTDPAMKPSAFVSVRLGVCDISLGNFKPPQTAYVSQSQVPGSNVLQSN